LIYDWIGRYGGHFFVCNPIWIGWVLPASPGYIPLLYTHWAIYLLYIHQKVADMSVGTVFVNNRTQAVRLPAETRFPETVKKVVVRVVGKERILTPADQLWDSFFMAEEGVSDDFLTERASQQQQAREAL
jgi:antitoxin VapB